MSKAQLVPGAFGVMCTAHLLQAAGSRMAQLAYGT